MTLCWFCEKAGRKREAAYGVLVEFGEPKRLEACVECSREIESALLAERRREVSR